jgi:hypothetical protein
VKQGTKRDTGVLADYGIGKQDMAIIYMSQSPYHEAFQQVMDIRKFDLATHSTAGLEFYVSRLRLHVKDVVPSTPAAKMPEWRSRLRGAWLIQVNGKDVSSPEDVVNALRSVTSHDMGNVELLLSHPEI